ncbi:hypothetical protein BLNAU_16783 [Blattamonas nauphoetae]|uniref:Right handed beta helix domain-containing protein n=1 Tax=Blattamonas nauphoetae TaxID=2049346 RepID=A0ABQ9X828_9EUKA|nr:hypothetical protein BLNAU_16783 [Blattamonas nauphoetae]
MLILIAIPFIFSTSVFYVDPIQPDSLHSDRTKSLSKVILLDSTECFSDQTANFSTPIPAVITTESLGVDSLLVLWNTTASFTTYNFNPTESRIATLHDRSQLLVRNSELTLTHATSPFYVSSSGVVLDQITIVSKTPVFSLVVGQTSSDFIHLLNSNITSLNILPSQTLLGSSISNVLVKNSHFSNIARNERGEFVCETNTSNEEIYSSSFRNVTDGIYGSVVRGLFGATTFRLHSTHISDAFLTPSNEEDIRTEGEMCFGENAVLTNCVFERCTAKVLPGAALYSMSLQTTVKECIFRECYTPSCGGAIAVIPFLLSSSVFRIESSKIIDCSTTVGAGGFFVVAGKHTLDKLLVENCHTIGIAGGGFLWGRSEDIEIHQSRFESCHATAAVGGLYIQNLFSADTIIDSQTTFINCSSFVVGGLCVNSEKIDLINVRFRNCNATGAGFGGAFVVSKNGVVQDVLFEECWAKHLSDAAGLFFIKLPWSDSKTEVKFNIENLMIDGKKEDAVVKVNPSLTLLCYDVNKLIFPIASNLVNVVSSYLQKVLSVGTELNTTSHNSLLTPFQEEEKMFTTFLEQYEATSHTDSAFTFLAAVHNDLPSVPSIPSIPEATYTDKTAELTKTGRDPRRDRKVKDANGSYRASISLIQVMGILVLCLGFKF